MHGVVSSKRTSHFFEKLKAGDDQGLLQEIEGQIGLSLIVRRIKLGLSQSELAERVGVREQQIQRYESERYASITVRSSYKE